MLIGIIELSMRFVSADLLIQYQQENIYSLAIIWKADDLHLSLILFLSLNLNLNWR